MAKIRFAVCMLLLTVPGLLLLASPAAADAVKWSRVDIPTEGRGGNWVLASGSDVKHLTIAADSTLYAYANPSGTDRRLFKSTDGGYSWAYTGEVTDAIVDIATAPDDAGIIYYATSANVYRSTDAGADFSQLPANPGGAGSNNITITSIAVSHADNNRIIAIATRDSDSSEYGGIYTLDAGQMLPQWTDTNLGNYDVYAVAFSPNYAADGQLVTVATDESDTVVISKIGNAGWGATTGSAQLDRDNSGNSVAVDTSADIAFPDAYDASVEDQLLFIAIDAGSDDGDVYQIEQVDVPGSSIATDLNIGSAYGSSNVDVTSLAVSGDAATATILAGAASAQVYRSQDGGESWRKSTKPPTGGDQTYVLLAPNFNASSMAYAATSGSESAISITRNAGGTWNQIGLIDTEISMIVDLSHSPRHGQDNMLFMLTYLRQRLQSVAYSR